MKKEFICTSCGYQGSPVTKTKGSFVVEVVLWFFFLIPGLIYSIWRLRTRRHTSCPKCHGVTLIPIDSPIGQKLVANQNSSTPINPGKAS